MAGVREQGMSGGRGGVLPGDGRRERGGGVPLRCIQVSKTLNSTRKTSATHRISCYLCLKQDQLLSEKIDWSQLICPEME